MKHVYAEALRWMADGETIIARRNGGTEAIFPDEHSTPSIVSVIDGEEGWEFRLKPRTVMIGSREVEAPVLEPEEGQRLWFWDSCTSEACGGKPLKEEASTGEWFASAEASEAAFRAYTSLLRGEQ